MSSDTIDVIADWGPSAAADGAPVAPPEAPKAARPAAPAAGDEELVIRPRTGWIAIDWRELLRCRELLYFLVWRDVKVRYKQTALGVGWAVLQPLFTMAIFTVIFGRFAGMDVWSRGAPYPVFIFTGLIPWMFFSNGVSTAGVCLVQQQHLLTKIYFPRLYVPTAAVGPFLVDMVVSFGLYALIMLYYGVAPSWRVVFLPVLLAFTLMATLGLGYMLAAVTVLYKDFRFTIPFLVQVLMFVSPVIYPMGMLSRRFRWVLRLNPMCGVIESYRSCILGTPFDWPSIAVGAAVTVALFVFGLFFFRKMERFFADIA
jgi:lipopolysaccharide transport system permease protein